MNKKYVIGINEGQNSSVVLQRDNEIIFAAQEERFNKIKEFTGFPEEALKYVLKNFNLSEQAYNISMDLKRKCQKLNGQFNILWHNSSLQDPRKKILYQNLIEK